MKITAIEIKNLRGFKELSQTKLSEKVNVFIGPNNAGKSTILNCIFSLQRAIFGLSDTTIGSLNNWEVKMWYSGTHLHFIPESLYHRRTIVARATGAIVIVDASGYGQNLMGDRIPQLEPQNLVYPYLSKRKVGKYSEEVNEEVVNFVSGDFTNLAAKVDRLITPQFQPGNKQYLGACKDILGFEISTLAKSKGKHAVYFIHNSEHIPLVSMGEGVANIVGLIVDLCIAENKIFLIEEPENDIHPAALKALLKLIIEKSATNQFFVSTHSNIVMKYLGSAPEAKVFKVTNDERDAQRPNMFLSKLEEVGENEADRRQVLEELGYDFFDFGLWEGWLFLEEASAENIIRNYLIPSFTPKLKNRIKTFSSNGTSQMKSKFEDFNRLFVFLHLEPTYKNKVWVMIDGGSEETKIIEEMRTMYEKSGWEASHFDQFSKHDFEEYYPQYFKEEVTKVLAITDKQKRREAKRKLNEEVRQWADSNPVEAKEAFKSSAQEVIAKLRQIEKAISKA